MKNVRIVVRSTTSRVPFREGAYGAVLEDARNFSILGKTRASYDSWAAAAQAALKLADKRSYHVTNRGLIERRIVAETQCTACQGPIDKDGGCRCEECSTCLGVGKIRDGTTRDLRKCLDCNGAGMNITGPGAHRAKP